MSYHGEVPVTKSDAKLAKKHLKATYKLNKAKIKDHQKAAKKASDPKSVSYNRSHSAEHQKDNQGVQASLKTLYNKVKGDNMNTKKANVSPGLASYFGKKKFGAKTFANMAKKS